MGLSICKMCFSPCTTRCELVPWMMNIIEVDNGTFVRWLGIGVHKDDGEGVVAFCADFLGIFRRLRCLLILSEMVTRIKVLKDTNLGS